MTGQEVKVWANRNVADILPLARVDIQLDPTFIFTREVGREKKGGIGGEGRKD